MNLLRLSGLAALLLWCGLSLAAAPGFHRAEPGEWVLRRGEKVTVRYEGVPGNLIVVDYYGAVKQLPVRNSPDGKTGEFELPAGETGFFTVVHLPEKTRQRFAVVPEVPEHSTFDNPFGVNYHLSWGSAADAARMLKMARYIGLDWARGVVFDWAGARDGSGEELFRRFQPQFEALRESGVHCLGGIYFVPRMYSGTPPGTPDAIALRALQDDVTPVSEFCRALVRHLPFIRHWEVSNEPDASIFWCGRYKNYLAHDSSAIIGDYVDYLAAAYKGFKSADPECTVLFGGLTAHSPEGHTWKPFWKTALEKGAGNCFDVGNIHYWSDLAAHRRIMRECGVSDRPFWLTECGFCSGGGPGLTEKTQVFRDITEQVIQLSRGVEKVFKYDFRDDGDNRDNAEHNFGMVLRDFSPKPTYVAHAVMIAKLLNTRASTERNVLGKASRGFLKCFEFQGADSRPPVNVLWLNLAPKATVTLLVKGRSPVKMTDVMGRETMLSPDASGEIRFEVDDNPFYLEGTVDAPPGPVSYPEDRIVRRIPIPLVDPSFDAASGKWRFLFDAQTVKSGISGGIAFVENSAPGVKNFCQMVQMTDISAYMKQLGAREYYKLRLSCRVRRTGVMGRGASLTYSFYNSDWKRIAYRDLGYRTGTHEWMTETLVSLPIPPETRYFAAEYYLGPGTYGRVELDDFAAELEVWERPDL